MITRVKFDYQFASATFAGNFSDSDWIGDVNLCEDVMVDDNKGDDSALGGDMHD